MKFKPKLKNLPRLVLLFLLATIITVAGSAYIPIDGYVLWDNTYIGCGEPYGFPIVYTGHGHGSFDDNQICIGLFDPPLADFITLFIDVVFWMGVLYIFWYLSKKILVKIKSAPK